MLQEIFGNIWAVLGISFGGVSLLTIMVTAIVLILKASVAKMINRINVEKIIEKSTDKGIERVRKISFTHSIQPLVESKLQEVNEYAVKVVKGELEKVQEKYDKLVNVIECLAEYFDNSIGVAEDKKEQLKNAIAIAKGEKVEEEVESTIVEEIQQVESKEEETTIVVER